MDGHTEFEQLSAGLPYTTCPPMQTLHFPLTAVVGISYRPTPKWNLEFDADYTDWSSFDTTTIYPTRHRHLRWTAKLLVDTQLAAELDV